MTREDNPENSTPTRPLMSHNALLIDSLTTIHQAHHVEDIDVAVVYGAGHIPALAHQLLQRYGYRPRTAEWLTIFDL